MIGEFTSNIAGTAAFSAVVAIAVRFQGMIDAVCGRLDARARAYFADVLPSIQTRWAPNRDVT